MSWYISHTPLSGMGSEEKQLLPKLRSSTLESLGAFKKADVLNSVPQDSDVMGSGLWPRQGRFWKTP